MLKQIILGTRYERVKYHSQVKYIVFQCNYCGKEFARMESYARKQVKIHKNACCFCSPGCRVKYFKNQSDDKTVSHIIAVQKELDKSKSVLSWVKNMLKK